MTPARLRELAEAATQGPWTLDDTSDQMSDRLERPVETGWFREGPGQLDVGDYETLTLADATYIAACSPDVIRALLDTLAEREAQVTALQAEVDAIGRVLVRGHWLEPSGWTAVRNAADAALRATEPEARG